MRIHGQIYLCVELLFCARHLLVSARNATCVRMNFDMARIDHELFKIRLINHRFQHFHPNPLVSPAAKTPLNCVPMAVFRRQISLWRTCSKNPEHAVQKLPRVFCIATSCPFIYGIWLEQFSHCVEHIMPSIVISYDDTPSIERFMRIIETHRIQQLVVQRFFNNCRVACFEGIV